VVVAADRTEPVERRHAQAGGRVGIGRAARGRVRDRETQPLRDGLGLRDQPARPFELLHGQPRDEDVRVDRRVGHLRRSGDRAHGGLGLGQALGGRGPDIDLEFAPFSHHVGSRPAGDLPDVDRDARPATVEVVELTHDTRRLDDGTPPLLRLDAGVRGATMDGQPRVEDPLAGRHDVAVRTRTFEDQAGVDIRGGGLDVRCRAG
jgi:hypothetical protein